MGYAEQNNQQNEYSLQENLGGFLAYQNGYRLAADEPVALDIQDIGYGGADEDDAKGKEESHKHTGGEGKTDSIWGSTATTAPRHGHEDVLGTRRSLRLLNRRFPGSILVL